MPPSLLMALFRPLLLQSTMPAPGVPAWLPGAAIGLLGLLLSLYFALRKEAREDGMTSSQRMKKLEAAVATQGTRQDGFQQEIEHVSDDAKRAREMQQENHRRDIDALKESIKDVPSMRELLARIDENMKSYKADVGEIKGKMDRLYELLTKR